MSCTQFVLSFEHQITLKLSPSNAQQCHSVLPHFIWGYLPASGQAQHSPVLPFWCESLAFWSAKPPKNSPHLARPSAHFLRHWTHPRSISSSRRTPPLSPPVLNRLCVCVFGHRRRTQSVSYPPSRISLGHSAQHLEWPMAMPWLNKGHALNYRFKAQSYQIQA